jgi:hypothetical protein
VITQPHTNKEIAQWLVQFGHHWNESFPNLLNIDQGRAEKMDGSESDFRELVQSFQLWDANVEEEVLRFHKGRALQLDGNVGPATLATMALPRCAMPDFPPPPNASFKYDDPNLQSAVESYQEYHEWRLTEGWVRNELGLYVPPPEKAEEYKKGSGSWPVGCDPERKDVHSTVAWINDSNASSEQKAQLEEVLLKCSECEAEIGQALRIVRSNTAPQTYQHRVYYRNIPGGTIGLGWFPSPNRCNQVVEAHIDNSFRADKYTQGELLQHEFKGHCDGLDHTRGGIMNSSIGRPTKWMSWVGDPHERTKKSYFGGTDIRKPTTPVPPIPPVTPPGTPGDPLSGAVVTVTLPNGATYQFVRRLVV